MTAKKFGYIILFHCFRFYQDVPMNSRFKKQNIRINKGTKLVFGSEIKGRIFSDVIFNDIDQKRV